jgi:hypothetical protein
MKGRNEGRRYTETEENKYGKRGEGKSGREKQ